MFDPRRCVYHYTPAQTAADHILTSMSLRMGSFEHLNDPREAKMWPFKFYARTAEPFDRDLFRLATEFVTKRSLIMCCSGNASTVSQADDHFGFGYAHPRMWAQYAEKHRGVCLALDRAELDTSVRETARDRQVFAGSVEYHETNYGSATGVADPYSVAYLEDVARADLATVMEPHIARHQRDLFFTKHADWRDEWEYRWVVRSSDDEPLLVPITRALRGVLIGHDCPPDLLERIVSVCSKQQVPVHRIFWHGWAVSIFGDLLDPAGTEGISLNGISFSTLIPCDRVYVQACDDLGRTRAISIDSQGQVTPLD